MRDSVQTERLCLRHPGLEDAPAFHALFADAEVMRYGSRLPHTEMAQTIAVLETTIADNAAGKADYFAVFLGDTFVGGAGVWRDDEIGFMFLRPFWGRGLAREAVGAVIEDARARGRRRLVADVDPRNLRSLGLLRRLGFAVTGEAQKTWKLGDLWTDSVYLEWRSPASDR